MDKLRGEDEYLGSGVGCKQLHETEEDLATTSAVYSELITHVHNMEPRVIFPSTAVLLF